MTDEVQSQAQGEQTQQEGAPAMQAPAGGVAIGGDSNASAPGHLTVEEVEAKRNAENLARAKEGGYQDPPEPSIGERVNALVAAVQHAMDHNAPMTTELFEEMKALLGARPAA